MIRFIFACMMFLGVCFVAIAMMPVISGISTERQQLIQQSVEIVQVPPMPSEEDPFAPLYADIMPAAGDDTSAEVPGSDSFGNSFTSEPSYVWDGGDPSYTQPGIYIYGPEEDVTVTPQQPASQSE